MEKDSLSIIIPVYNGEKTVRRCLESVLLQEGNITEIIVVDDGSTDNSLEICSEIAQSDHRVSVIHKENGGVSSARNKGLEAAKGDFLMFVDCDDTVENGYFEAFLKNSNLVRKRVIVISKFIVLSKGNQSSYVEGDAFEEGIIYDKDSLVEIWKKHLWNSPINKIYLRDTILLNNIRFDEKVVLGEDWLFNNAYTRAVKPTGYYFIKDRRYNYYFDDTPNRHGNPGEFYYVNKRQVEDFKQTLNVLGIDREEIVKFDKVDLDFTIAELRRIARDRDEIWNRRLSRIAQLEKEENVLARMRVMSQLYSIYDKLEFSSGCAIVIFLWENIRKKIGMIRRKDS